MWQIDLKRFIKEEGEEETDDRNKKRSKSFSTEAAITFTVFTRNVLMLRYVKKKHEKSQNVQLLSSQPAQMKYVLLFSLLTSAANRTLTSTLDLIRLSTCRIQTPCYLEHHVASQAPSSNQINNITVNKHLTCVFLRKYSVTWEKQNNHVTPASPARSIDSLLFNISLLTQTVCFFKIVKNKSWGEKTAYLMKKKNRKLCKQASFPSLGL